MPLVVLILGSTLLQPVWRFTPGQEFFVEETHRQLLTVNHDAGPVTTYVDYSAVLRYKVTQARGDQATVEATVEKIRINNTNEAGAKAVEAIKQRDKAKTTWRLTRSNGGWQGHAVSPSSEVAPPIFLTLGSPLGP